MPTHSEHLTDDKALLSAIVAAVQAAGSVMQSRFSVDTRLGSREEVVAAIYANDEASLVPLREALTKARPSAGWVEDELEGGALPPGEWWITDPVEGNINHIHGMTDWGVTATLVRDNVSVLTAVHLPLIGNTYTAVRGAARSPTRTGAPGAWRARTFWPPRPASIPPLWTSRPPSTERNPGQFTHKGVHMSTIGILGTGRGDFHPSPSPPLAGLRLIPASQHGPHALPKFLTRSRKDYR